MSYVNITWLMIGLLSLASNSIVTCIILSCRKLRNYNNALLCSMLISSCAISILYILPGRAFVESTFLCSIIPSVAYASITCYGLHLCATCLDKMISILSPFRHRNLLTARNITATIICLWITPYLLCAIPFLTYRPYSSQYCIYDNYTQEDYDRDTIFHTVFFTSMIFIPIGSTIMLYVVAFVKVNGKKRKKLTNTFIGQNIKGFNADKNWKIARQMILMLGLFMICWLPLFVSFVAMRYSDTIVLYILLDIFHYMAFGYHIFNPIFIAYFHIRIRRQIKHLCSIISTPIRTKLTLSVYPNTFQLGNNKNQLQSATSCKQSKQNSRPVQQQNNNQIVKTSKLQKF